MQAANYVNPEEITEESTPAGYYWARDTQGQWKVVEINYVTLSSGAKRIFIDACGWDGGWGGLIDLGPRIEPPQ